MRDVQSVFRGVSIGTRVRIERVAGARAEGLLREKHSDAVTIGNGEVMERITYLEVTRVWKQGTYALQGALLGALAGLIFAGVLVAKAFALLAGFLVGKVLIVGAIILVALGALFGGALGAWVNRWVRVWG